MAKCFGGLGAFTTSDRELLAQERDRQSDYDRGLFGPVFFEDALRKCESNPKETEILLLLESEE